MTNEIAPTEILRQTLQRLLDVLREELGALQQWDAEALPALAQRKAELEQQLSGLLPARSSDLAGLVAQVRSALQRNAFLLLHTHSLVCDTATLFGRHASDEDYDGSGRIVRPIRCGMMLHGTV